MFALTCALGISLLIILAVQVKWANRFVDLYDQPARQTGEPYLPHVGVIMALRGADPFLEDSLRGLMSLDYPSHEIRIIIDSEVDPAYTVVNRVRQEMDADNVEIEILNVCQETSSLKNSALIQGINGCSDRCEAYAWLDSDTVPYAEWLTDLVAPLKDENIGAACGIRWYAPPTNTLANYVRHIWNSAAVLQMVAYEIGWGGAFAIRRSLYEEVGLETKWCRALVEDTLASNEVLLGGRRVEFVAGCTMPNPENASLSWCVRFVTRQLQGLRYYHDAWRLVLIFGILSGAVLLGNALMIPWSLVAGNYLCAGMSAGVFLIFGLVAGWLMHRSEKRVNAYLGDRAVGDLSRPLSLVMAAPVAQIVHLVALVRAYLLTDVTWRGIRYRIRGGMEITRTNYAPYVPETDIVQHSL